MMHGSLFRDVTATTTLLIPSFGGKHHRRGEQSGIFDSFSRERVERCHVILHVHITGCVVSRGSDTPGGGCFGIRFRETDERSVRSISVERVDWSFLSCLVSMVMTVTKKHCFFCGALRLMAADGVFDASAEASANVDVTRAQKAATEGSSLPNTYPACGFRLVERRFET